YCTNSCIHGICVGPEECECQPGFGGPTCNISCPSGKYGSQCERDCICQNKALCDPVTGACACKPGWQGSDCSEPCDDGYYGYHCEQECRCENGASCNPISGACECAPGYRGPL
ncbi:protein draper, partial [Trichonephila clavata]